MHIGKQHIQCNGVNDRDNANTGRSTTMSSFHSCVGDAMAYKSKGHISYIKLRGMKGTAKVERLTSTFLRIGEQQWRQKVSE